MSSQILKNCDGDISLMEMLEAINFSSLNHINSFNRLIDNDMYSYIYCVMHILGSCDFLKDESDIFDIYTFYAEKTTEKFIDFICVTSPIGNRLVKLK